jgi:hypothetical protein
MVTRVAAAGFIPDWRMNRKVKTEGEKVGAEGRRAVKSAPPKRPGRATVLYCQVSFRDAPYRSLLIGSALPLSQGPEPPVQTGAPRRTCRCRWSPRAVSFSAGAAAPKFCCAATATGARSIVIKVVRRSLGAAPCGRPVGVINAVAPVDLPTPNDPVVTVCAAKT